MDCLTKYKEILKYRCNHILPRKGNHRHHIFPKTMHEYYKTKSISDTMLHKTVILTPTEHAVVHYLLWHYYNSKRHLRCYAKRMETAYRGLSNNIKVNARYRFQIKKMRDEFCKKFEISD